MRLAPRLALGLALASAASIPAACGRGRSMNAVVQGATAADRAFLDEMALVLETARESSAQALAHAARPELKAYAREARDEHARHVSAIRSLDQALFDDETAGLGAIPALISPGPNFDREWLTSMIELHQLAVEIAAARLGDRGDPQAEALARRLHATESQELEQLRAWAREWFGA